MNRILLVTIFFSIIFSTVSIIRHNHYFSQGQDLAIFSQTAWLYSNNLTPYNTITNTLDYHDRYKPIMLLIGFAYRIWRDPRLLLIIQGSALSFSGYFLYKIARILKLSESQSFLILIHYLLFPGITSFVIDDFHEVALYPLFFAGSLYFYLRKNKGLFSLFTILSLIVREHLTVFTLVFWISLFFSKNKLLKNSLSKLSLILSVSFTVFMFIIINTVGGIAYQSFIKENDSLSQAFLYLISRPINSLISFFTPAAKMSTLLTLITYYLFLPFSQIWLLPPVIFQLAGRFFDFQHSYRWTLFYHYSAELAVILTFGLILTLANIPARKRRLLVYFLLFLTVFYAKLLHSPLFLLTKKTFVTNQAWMSDISNTLKFIPPNAAVAAQNNLVPHLANRQEIYILPDVNNAEYIVLDLRTGQDQFNFYSYTHAQMANLLHTALQNDYFLYQRRGDVYLLRKTPAGEKL